MTPKQTEPNTSVEASIPVGTVLPSPADTPLAIWTDEADLRPHVDRAWLRAYASAYLGADPRTPGAGGRKTEAAVPVAALVRHACVFGSVGSGKSRLTLRLLAEQMKRGCSVLALDPKSETIEHLIAAAREAGVPEERVTVLDPADLGAGVPGWNPLQTDIPPDQAAVALVSILKHNSPTWGPRLGDILTNALILLATHGLSLYELPRLLTRPDYCAGLLRLPRPPRTRRGGGHAAFTEAWEFFAREFCAWSASDQAAAVGPVLTRTRGLLRSDFFQALLGARRNTLDLASLWREPGVVLVHLDSTTLGDDGAQLLGGLLAHHLYLTAMRRVGPVPVVLALDELGAQEEFVGDALYKIATIARGQNLRLLVATQHLAQLSEGLRKALLTNSQAQFFFQLGPDDAPLAARGFVPGAPEPLQRVTARVASRDRATGLAALSEWRHELLSPHGRPLRLEAAAWEDFRRKQTTAVPGKGYALRRVQELAGSSGVARLYVRAADTGEFAALAQYVAGLPETDYWFDGPAPLELVVSFPTPQFVHAQKRSRSDLADRWTDVLQKLPTRHAVLCVGHAYPSLVQIADVSVPGGSASDGERSRAARSANAQPWEEVEETADWRAAQVERLAGRPEGPPAAAPHTAPPKTRRASPVHAAADSAGVGTTDGAGPPPQAAAARPEEERVADDGSLA